MKKMHCAWEGELSPVAMTTFLCFTAVAEFTPVAYIETDGQQ